LKLGKILSALIGRKAERRPVLVHAHMFKNAGTTFDWSLQRSFSEAFLDHRDDDSMRKGAKFLGPFLRQEKELKAISSHWITFPVPELDDIDIRLALLFRDPIERIRSVYNFERRQEPAETPGAKMAKELEFVEYVKWRLQSAPGPAIKNFHTRYCSGDYFGENLEAMYEASVATIRSTPLVGLVHRYEESMVLFEHHLQQTFPDLDLSWQRKNTTEGNLPSLTERRQRVERELESIMDLVLESNRFDIQLYEEVEKQFERSLSRIPDLKLKLQDIRARNAELV